MAILILYILELILNILKLVYNPKKNYYKSEHFYNKLYVYYYKNSHNNIEDVDNYYVNTTLKENLESAIHLNEAVFAFSILLFILSVFVCFSYIYKYKFNNDKEFLHCNLCIITFKFFFAFIEWAMALRIIYIVNKIKSKSDKKFLTDEIKDYIIKVIVILSFDLILYFFQFLLVYCKYDKDYDLIKVPFGNRNREINPNPNSNQEIINQNPQQEGINQNPQ